MFLLCILRTLVRLAKRFKFWVSVPVGFMALRRPFLVFCK